MTAMCFTVVGGLLIALIMFFAGKRRRRRGSQELTETAPVYEVPHFSTRSNPDMELKENVCYGKKI